MMILVRDLVLSCSYLTGIKSVKCEVDTEVKAYRIRNTELSFSTSCRFGRNVYREIKRCAVE